ncbi:hypothetical protein [Lysinibacillus sphaericus]|uniref:Uncharacterized protein n=2 Tax=Lysinibacillus sphaericus TaxID=1421 RepID=A0A6G9ZZN6_LYSSH|nr:hypothetical protein [Lysinibacillus sphaericus]MBE5085751.1 hypothetical protein [Bacillus thuringiensis]ACA42238.1 hypothetical protein Bsph_p008 [Lysinibacillus sphaericus C3-41]AMO35382.1 hypothetical protein AR327_23105 [Lysinibacillus sphaericus]AMR93015.1 hypothetical protein A1T07_22680 [Lysinibacillus sphaericus]AMR93186.1 hypothetical protein A1T07_23555 [Lysinibacillus sphaericus]
MDNREQFLNYQINLANKMLGVTFNGTTLQEKECFFQQYNEPLRNAVAQMFSQMHVARTAIVIRFGDGCTETDWVVAESKEQAVQFYMEVMKGTDIELEDLEISDIDIQLEYMLYKEDEVPVADQVIFNKSKTNGYLEVPFVYAISYALENGMKLPDIIQSFE